MMTNTFELRAARYQEDISFYISRIRQAGIKRIGSGGWATVFQHPTMPEVAVKVFRDDDIGFSRYLKFCKKNPRNPYCLRVVDPGDTNVKPYLPENHDAKQPMDHGYSIVFGGAEALHYYIRDRLSQVIANCGTTHDARGVPPAGSRRGYGTVQPDS